MNREELKEYLKHREPMLLLDSVDLETKTDKEGNEVLYSYGSYQVRGDEFFLQGHFPDYPVVPGVIICEIMAQSCALLLGEEIKTKLTFYTGIDNVRFKGQVRPGDVIKTTSYIVDRRKSLIFVRAEATVNGKVCCKGDLSFALI
ncbi:MAG: 3-hydroxyacyl-ACP dehydratase FabZ family protein [Paludibacteraceae bacterium]|nr:3-hydroxyacyl-ACP dehydratase FabZ family protein [Paludibacteraceae bacterium]